MTGTSKNEKVTTLTNTHTPELTSITGTKTWKDADNQDGKRPESITVNLFADETNLKSQSVSADADGNWSYSFTDLPKYANGQEITYTVTEDAVDATQPRVMAIISLTLISQRPPRLPEPRPGTMQTTRMASVRKASL